MIENDQIWSKNWILENFEKLKKLQKLLKNVVENVPKIVSKIDPSKKCSTD